MASIKIYHRPTGDSHRVNWRDPATRRSCSKSFYTAAEAEDFRRIIEGQIAAGSYSSPIPGKITFEAYWSRFLAGKRNLTPKTRVGYEGYGTRNLMPFFGHRTLNSINADVISQWMTWAESQEFSAWTIREAFVVLRSAMSYAKKLGLVTDNPCTGMASDLPNVPEARTKVILSPQKVMALADRVEPRYRGAVLVMGVLGLRPGEMIGLRVGDLSLVEGFITVRRSVVVVSGRMQANTTTKTKTSRRVDLPGFLQDALIDHVAQFVKNPTDDDALVFTTPRGKGYMHTTQLRMIVKAAGAEIGEPRLTSYDLRHTATVNGIEATGDVKAVSEMLGHSDVSMTLNVYNHTSQESRSVAMGKLDQAYSRDG